MLWIVLAAVLRGALSVPIRVVVDAPANARVICPDVHGLPTSTMGAARSLADRALDARAALEFLEPIRLVRTQVGDQLFHCITQQRPNGADLILGALDLLPLPAVLPD